MAASQSSAVRSLPSGIYSPLTARSLGDPSSLNSALKTASSSAESTQAQQEEEEEDERASELQRLDQGEVLKPALSLENGLRGGEGSKVLSALNGEPIPEELQSLTSQLSTVGSLPLDDLPEEDDEIASTSDSEPFEASELEIIEAALRSLRSVDEEEEEEQVEGCRALEHDLPGSSDLHNLQDVARLLKKVQAVKARKRGAPMKHMTPALSGSFRQGPSGGGEDRDPGDIRQVVQAAAQTALAAAKTAETVVSSLNRNSQAMEELCKALTLRHSLHHPSTGLEEEEDEEEEEQQDLLAIELKQTEMAKSLIRQNRVTHWVLGFIVVSSLIWRYGVVKFVKQVNNTISNPFQGFTDMLKGQKEQIDKEHNLPQWKFPSIMDDDDDDDKRKRQAAREKENKAFSFGSFFSGNDEEEAERKEAERRRQNKKAKEKEGFNLSSFLPGFNGEEEAEVRKAEQKAK